MTLFAIYHGGSYIPAPARGKWLQGLQMLSGLEYVMLQVLSADIVGRSDKKT